MKRALLPLVLALPVIYAAGGCSAEDTPTTVPAVGGTPGAAGSPAMGGSGPMAGSAPVAGTTPVGGGSGGSSGGSGGSGTSGAMTGGTGGSAGGSGGSGGGGGSGGQAEAPVNVGELDGMLLTTPCGGDTTTDDCPGSMVYKGMTYNCSNNALDSDSNPTLLDFPITGGVPGQHYTATMHFYGVMEPKNYGPSIQREKGTMRPSQSDLLTDGEPFATADGNATPAVTEYNNWEVHSFDENGQKIRQYFLNSDTQQGHYTFAISFERPIEIVSGGKVHVRTFDSNCRMIKNCEGGAPCAGKARTIPTTSADPMPMGLTQPGLGKGDNQAGQWLFIDVKDIVPM